MFLRKLLDTWEQRQAKPGYWRRRKWNNLKDSATVIWPSRQMRNSKRLLKIFKDSGIWWCFKSIMWIRFLRRLKCWRWTTGRWVDIPVFVLFHPHKICAQMRFSLVANTHDREQKKVSFYDHLKWIMRLLGRDIKKTTLNVCIPTLFWGTLSSSISEWSSISGFFVFCVMWFLILLISINGQIWSSKRCRSKKFEVLTHIFLFCKH